MNRPNLDEGLCAVAKPLCRKASIARKRQTINHVQRTTSLGVNITSNINWKCIVVVCDKLSEIYVSVHGVRWKPSREDVTHVSFASFSSYRLKVVNAGGAALVPV